MSFPGISAFKGRPLASEGGWPAAETVMDTIWREWGWKKLMEGDRRSFGVYNYEYYNITRIRALRPYVWVRGRGCAPRAPSYKCRPGKRNITGLNSDDKLDLCCSFLFAHLTYGKSGLDTWSQRVY
jgi:hypothetical protein